MCVTSLREMQCCDVFEAHVSAPYGICLYKPSFGMEIRVKNLLWCLFSVFFQVLNYDLLCVAANGLMLLPVAGGRRFSEGTSADREIQRTLMEVGKSFFRYHVNPHCCVSSDFVTIHVALLTFIWLVWLRYYRLRSSSVVEGQDVWSSGLEFNSHRITALFKPNAHMCLCHWAVNFWSSQRLATVLIWEGKSSQWPCFTGPVPSSLVKLTLRLTFDLTLG